MPKQKIVVDTHLSCEQMLVTQLWGENQILVPTSQSDALAQLADLVPANAGFDAIDRISQGAPGQIHPGE